ncbi:MAG: tRNA (N6-isopentenyl adenosine(37)-C2)-methylthiotransferase MiaB [Candidatus Omnitrophota bacterium]
MCIKTFGCQMNFRDSEIILGMLTARGFTPVTSEKEADIILFNTCSVRQHAEERVWGQLGKLLKQNKKYITGKPANRQTGKPKIIGIVGCMAQAYQDAIFRRFPQVDLICGPANIYDIPDLVTRAIREKTQLLAVANLTRPLLPESNFRADKLKALVNIMYGCNNFCSYCIVPYVRGREISRPLADIIREITDLARSGIKEVTLLGQNVNSYGRDLAGKVNFVHLLEQVDAIDGIARIRFMTSHPKDATKDLFQAMRTLPKLCEHLHLPLQSGSDKVLRLMNRKYTLKDYLKLVAELRWLIPECALTTDIIVGFPGETKSDFEETRQAMKKIQFDEAFIFKYSPRPETQAARLKDNVMPQEKEKRHQALLTLQAGIGLKKNKKLIGKTLEVLAEEEGRDFSGQVKTTALVGRTRTNKVTLFCGKRDLISQAVRVKICRSTPHTLIGESNEPRPS